MFRGSLDATQWNPECKGMHEANPRISLRLHPGYDSTGP